MINILCFGDSNTYGESPEGFGRYPRNERWTGILQKSLGDDFYVIEEGLNGRTTVWEDPIEGDKCGLRHLPTAIATHTPLDLLIIMLGTNDLKPRFSVPAGDIALSVERLVLTAKQIPNYTSDHPFKILVVAPAHVRPTTKFGDMYGDQHKKSLQLAGYMEEVAKRNNVEFLDISKVGEPSEIDGLHFDRGNHKKVAAAMEQKIREIFAEEA